MLIEQKNRETFSGYDVNIRLFGTFEVENSLGCIAEENPQKLNLAWPLLKYLLVNRGREVGVEELLGTIWPERYGPEAENAARVRLNRLRDYLKPLGLNGRNGLVLYCKQKYALNPLYEIYTDTDRFDELMLKIRGISAEEPFGLQLCGKALELYRGPYLKYTKSGYWFDPIRESYDDEFHKLAFNTVDRILATGNDKLLSLLSRRALDMRPDDLALHKAILNCYARFDREPEGKRHTAQLMRAGVVAKWLSVL